MGNANYGDYGQQANWTRDLMRDRFSQLTDPHSGYNRSLLGQYQMMARNLAPSTSQLMSMNAGAGGMSYGSGQFLAGQQRKAGVARAMEQGSRSFMSHLLNNESQARGYLGDAGRMDTERWGIQKQIDQQNSFNPMGFLNQALGLVGGGFLGGHFGNLFGGGGGTPKPGITTPINTAPMYSNGSNYTPPQGPDINFGGDVPGFGDFRRRMG